MVVELRFRVKYFGAKNMLRLLSVVGNMVKSDLGDP